MTTISVDDIQRDLSGYLDRVQAGETFIITDQNRPIAEVKPIESAASGQRPFGLCAGEFEVPADFDDPLSDLMIQDRESSVRCYLKGRISDAKVQPRWRSEGVADPTEDCRQSCFTLAEQLYSQRGLLPAKVVATRRDGIYLEYKSPNGGRVLGIELDNELDIVAAVSDADKVLASAAFEGAQAEEILRIFVSGAATSVSDSRTAST